jgi:hypothetical protein
MRLVITRKISENPFAIGKQTLPMDLPPLQRWAFIVAGILVAILAANRLTAFLIAMLGLRGSAGFITGFILYAALFFTILSIIEKITGFSFFRFSWQD